MWPAPSKKRSKAEGIQTLVEASRNPEGMQDPPSMPGLAGRIFGRGGGGGGLERRRMRGYGQLQQPVAPPPVIKCPRCDSANTKFCYYNNYNLSQPRHFCKSCRRYWTRGGVLRNVPVGGGCRKPSSSKKPSNAAGKERRRPTSSRSSSDTSTLATSTPPDPIVLPNSNLNPSASNPPPIRASEPFQASASFTDFMATNPAAIMGFGFSDLPQISMAEEMRLLEPSTVETTAFGDQTDGGGGGGFAGLDWAGPVMDPSIFDLASAVDHGLFWSQSQSQSQSQTQTHWADADPSSLYLP